MMSSSTLSTQQAPAGLAKPVNSRLAGYREIVDRAIGPRPLFVWRVLTSPFWLFTDLPKPALPNREDKALPAGPAAVSLGQTIDAFRRRVWLFWITTLLVRAITLALLAGIIWHVVDLAGGPAINEPALLILLAVLAGLGLVTGTLLRPCRSQVARMLDHSFGLKERLATALENIEVASPEPGSLPAIAYLQIADAANAAQLQRSRPSLRFRPPSREIATAVCMALLFATLYFLQGTTGDVNPVIQQPIPKFTSAAERFVQEVPLSAPAATAIDAQTLAEIQAISNQSADARQDLGTLASALDDHAVTQPIADAINRGDYAAASQGLRELAKNAGDLSGDTRTGLSQDLSEASNNMTNGGQQLADAAETAAAGLTADDNAASEGLQGLADSVDQAAAGIVSQQELNDQMESAQGGASSSSGSQQAGAESQDQGSKSGDSNDEGAQAGDSGQGNAENGAESGQQSSSANGDEAQAGTQSGSSGSESNQPSNDSGAGSAATDPTDQDAGLGNSGSDSGSQGAGGKEGEDASGSGAGDGTGGQQDQGADQNNAPNGDQSGAAAGESNEPTAETKPTTSDPPTGNGQDAADGDHSSVTLDESGNGDRVQLGGSEGSTAGSGAGAMVTSGSAVQGAIGEAGPDSNHVPPEYRSIVQSYFSDPSEP